jgi:hypothetical protein
MSRSSFIPAPRTTAQRLAAALLAGAIVAGSAVASLAPPAGAATAATIGQLDGVSCPTTTFCVAVGQGDDVLSSTSKTNAILEYRSGTWSTAELASSPDTIWQTVSCSSSSWCVAAGVTSGNLVAVAYYNGSWTIFPGVTTKYQSFAYAMQVSCSGTLCMIAGYSNTDVMKVQDASLTQEQFPTPGGDTFQSEGVWCGSATLCRLTGYAMSSAGDKSVEFEWNGTSWATWPPKVSSGLLGAPLGCSAAAFCVTWNVNETTNHMSVETYAGSAWTASSAAYTGHESGTEPTGFSCIGSTFCLQTGFFYNSAFTAFLPMAYVLKGTTWSLSTLPTLGKFAYLSSGSCASTTDCYAVGMSTKSTTLNGAKWTPVLLHYTGTSWASVAVAGLS